MAFVFSYQCCLVSVSSFNIQEGYTPPLIKVWRGGGALTKMLKLSFYTYLYVEGAVSVNSANYVSIMICWRVPGREAARLGLQQQFFWLGAWIYSLALMNCDKRSERTGAGCCRINVSRVLLLGVIVCIIGGGVSMSLRIYCKTVSLTIPSSLPRKSFITFWDGSINDAALCLTLRFRPWQKKIRKSIFLLTKSHQVSFSPTISRKGKINKNWGIAGLKPASACYCCVI